MYPLKISDYAGAMAALKHPELAQALYDDGRVVMADALITLHGKAHSQRRLAELKVFNRRYFQTYERAVFPQKIEPIVREFIEAGRVDLVEFGYRITMHLTADFAGIDHAADPEVVESLLALVKVFSAGATLVHSTRDRHQVEADVHRAMTEFDHQFLQPSIERRRALRSRGATLPNDVLSQLVELHSPLALTDEILRREMAFYLQAGAHSTANAMIHAVHNLFEWRRQNPTQTALFKDPAFIQKAVHESLRLHPASPVARRRALSPIKLNQQLVPEGTIVTIDLEAANRDPSVFGSNADQFDPQRALPGNVWPFGLSFGYGVHACLGKALDGGVVPNPKSNNHQHYGIVALLVHILLKHNARWIEHDPPRLDPNTVRRNWGYYPVSLENFK